MFSCLSRFERRDSREAGVKRQALARYAGLNEARNLTARPLSFQPMHLPARGKSSELNLVPYIDLLTCMVAFLLITAVWTQLAQLHVRQRAGGDQEPTETRLPLVILVDDDGFNLVSGAERQLLPRGDGYDFAGLARALQAWKRSYPDREDLEVASDDGVPFDTLVSTMDAALGAGFPALTVIPAQRVF
jgi:biopolymer transport protein TolR